MTEKRQSRDLLSRLADAGEEAIQRLGEAPGANRLAEVATTLRDRVDELQRRMRGLDELERRVAALEERLGSGGRGAASRTGRPRMTSRPAATPAKKTSSGPGSY